MQPGGILGFEGAGTVEKLGSDVQGLSVGDRVAFGFVGASKKTSINELITMLSYLSELFQSHASDKMYFTRQQIIMVLFLSRIHVTLSGQNSF